ncbi:MAG: diphthine synthase [Candidatus Aenigmarchaeota archaeon]|nr:diphthine synthase [Candidatus Aenigmarchaeota archaeon]
MLYIIGLGIGDESDISQRGLDACRKADEVCAELYTARWQGDLRKLGKAIGKGIKVLERQDLEDRSEKFVKGAKGKDVALLVPGDPLSATTHINLLMEARHEKIPFTVIHSSSIMTAIAETGLNIYNFGKTATVVRPQEGYAPTSFYEAGIINKRSGMHTLFLLDVDMDTRLGLEILLEIEKKRKRGVLGPDTNVVAASGIGTRKSIIRYDKVRNLLKQPLRPPAVLIIPGRRHFVEREWLDSLKERIRFSEHM